MFLRYYSELFFFILLRFKEIYFLSENSSIINKVNYINLVLLLLHIPVTSIN
jgi:hypothetical protein